MKTRLDYLAGKCTHREYYAQFVTAAVLGRVASRIGLDRIRKSQDQHLNDIPLSKWDALFQDACPADVNRMMREAGDFPTLAGMVSLAKEAARQLVETVNA